MGRDQLTNFRSDPSLNTVRLNQSIRRPPAGVSGEWIAWHRCRMILKTCLFPKEKAIFSE